ncbi:ABC transporter substrate-binding protein [Halegenticoccus soli]|uniref:ABC transporter substrate-binding protein n=1 Tax=Halegenticoccus soli TaxID=1985678 RepID=UPI000C6D802C|nr:ABC transporter substrate-binding protein [Halegenticoccus soli]
MSSTDGRSELRGTRRAVLASVAAASAAGTSGCVKRLRNVVGREPSRQISLEIKTVPADSDPYASRIARHLAENLETAGVAARVVPVEVEELYRQVLINQQFDLYVGQYPEARHLDPDSLYGLLHSRFSSESGWQNPFGYTNLTVDELLEEQRTTAGKARREAAAELQRTVAQTVPFLTVAFPDVLCAVRTDRFTKWRTFGPNSAVGLLSLERLPGADFSSDFASDGAELRLATTDPRITENRNPIAAEFRRLGTFIDLLYDSLCRRYSGTVNPWLAETVTWATDGRAPTVNVRLRDGLSWHDGTPLTADDVAFTYAFLADTTLGADEGSIPAPRFRGRVSLVDNVSVTDDRTVRIRFLPGSEAVADRALTIPLLPEHVWSEKTGKASIAGIEVNGETTEALIWNNPNPVGSGPFRFERSKPDESLVLSLFDDHFLVRDRGGEDPTGLPARPAFDRLRVQVVSSDVSAVELVSNDDADATISNLSAETVPRIARSPDLDLIAHRSQSFYHVGFNARQAPLSNPRFRHTVARLVDKSFLVRDVFGWYAAPAASPLAETRWLPEDLAWAGADPVTPFLGEAGEVSPERARSAFREAGYQYSENGKLLTR